MTEIERMFENAGISICKRKQGFTLKDCTDRECKKCGYYDLSFTAEKQLGLLKICFDKYERLEKVRGLKERCIIYHHFESNDYTEFVNCETWEETIAGLINNLWQSLTDQEKEEIRGILNERADKRRADRIPQKRN